MFPIQFTCKYILDKKINISRSQKYEYTTHEKKNRINDSKKVYILLSIIHF